MKQFLFAICTLLKILCLISLSGAAHAASLVVEWRDLKIPSGQVLYVQLVKVHGPASGYIDLPAQRSFAFRSDFDGKATVIDDLDAGKYIIRGFLDLDGDGELAKKKNGRPNEPFGFSHRPDKKVPFRPSRAVFALEPGGLNRIAFSMVSRL